MTGPLGGDDYDAFVGTHVASEIERIGAAVVVLRRYAPGSAEHRTALEAFLLHARHLDDFFGRGRQHTAVRPDDVLAADLAGWTPEPVLDPADRRAVDDALAHLTAGRTPDRTEQDWPVLAIAGRIIAVTQRWIPLLPAADGRRAMDAALDYTHRQLIRRPPTVSPPATGVRFNVGRRPEPPPGNPTSRR